MVLKTSSKGLSYEFSLPPFLAALRAEASGSQSPTPQRRPNAKKRSHSEELEDAPLIVDEHGNTIDLDAERDKEAQSEALGADTAQGNNADSVPKAAAETKSAVGVGGGKKHKAGRVVGGDDDRVKAKEVKDKEDGRGKGQAVKDTAGAAPASSSDKKAGRKKAKKIKLSFNEAEG